MWSDLIASNSNAPWIILGDFNALRYQADKIGGDNSWPSHMEDFNVCISALDMEDLKYSGCHFTWSNKQDPSHHISSKIDRVLVNEQWIKTFNCSSAHFHLPGISDHSPAVVFINPDPRRTKKPFKFFNFLVHHPDFLSTVQKVWRKVILGNPMFVVCEKLRLLQMDLKKLNTKDFSDISIRAIAARQSLDRIQYDLGQDPTNAILQSQERLLCKQYLTLARAEESFAKQKSRIQWLKLGTNVHPTSLSPSPKIGTEEVSPVWYSLMIPLPMIPLRFNQHLLPSTPISWVLSTLVTIVVHLGSIN